MPNNKLKVKESKLICDEEAKKLNFKKTYWRNVPVKNEKLGILAKANAPSISQWIICLGKDDCQDIEMRLFQLRKRIEKESEKIQKMQLEIVNFISHHLVPKQLSIKEWLDLKFYQNFTKI